LDQEAVSNSDFMYEDYYDEEVGSASKQAETYLKEAGSDEDGKKKRSSLMEATRKQQMEEANKGVPEEERKRFSSHQKHLDADRKSMDEKKQQKNSEEDS